MINMLNCHKLLSQRLTRSASSNPWRSRLTVQHSGFFSRIGPYVNASGMLRDDLLLDLPITREFDFGLSFSIEAIVIA